MQLKNSVLLASISVASAFKIHPSCDPHKEALDSAIEDMVRIADEGNRYLSDWGATYAQWNKDRNKRVSSKAHKGFFKDLFGESNRDYVNGILGALRDLDDNNNVVIFCGDEHLQQMRYYKDEKGEFVTDGYVDTQSTREGEKWYMWIDPSNGINIETEYHQDIGPRPCSLGLDAFTYNAESEPNGPDDLQSGIIICSNMISKDPTIPVAVSSLSGRQAIVSTHALSSVILHECMHLAVLGDQRCPGGGGHEFYNPPEALKREKDAPGEGKKNADSYALWAVACGFVREGWTVTQSGSTYKLD